MFTVNYQKERQRAWLDPSISLLTKKALSPARWMDSRDNCM